MHKKEILNFLKNKKGQSFGSLTGIFFEVGVVVIFAVVIIAVLVQLGNSVSNTNVTSAVNNGSTLILNTVSQFPTAGIIIGLGIILSVVFAFLGLRKGMGGGGSPL